MDISFNMLRHTIRHGGQRSLFVQYDGVHLPFPSNCFDACVTHWALIYLTDTALFCRTLKEIIRILKPGGRLIAVEQTCRKTTFNPEKMKKQRSTQEYLQLLEKAGLVNKSNCIIRRGHSPLIYLIRYGLIPSSLFPSIGKIDETFNKMFSRPYFDYADTLFVAEKPVD